MQKRIVFLLSLTLLLTVAWILSALYNTEKTSTISTDLQIAVSPINGTIDQSAVMLVTSRQQIDPLYTWQDSATSATNSAKSIATASTPASTSAAENPATQTVPVATIPTGTSP